MKDGYYLSVYIGIDKLLNVAATNKGIRHDQNISLWHKDGDKISLVRYWEIERLSGLRHHAKSFYDVDHAKETINQLLSSCGLSLDNIIELWGTPGLSNCDDYHSMEKYPDFPYHSIAHLFSTLMFDTEIFFNETVIGLAVDGGPDTVYDPMDQKKEWYMGAVVRKGEAEIFSVISPGRLWEISCDLFHMQEGTLMALAEASESVAFIDKIQALDLRDEASRKFADNYVKDIYKIIDQFTNADEGTKFNYFDSRFTEHENKISMVMKIVQQLSIRIMEKNIDKIVDLYKIHTEDTYLAISGGYALNCPTNSYLMNKYKFKGFLAPPCVNDSGISLGVALYAFHKKLGKFGFSLKHAFYGNIDNSIEANIDEYSEFIKNITDLDKKVFVCDIQNAPIVWFNNASELGPRALGNRSILADPRTQSSKDELNRIKRREWWRPVAPIVLEEDVDEWFLDSYPSPFMLHTFQIKEHKASVVPAILHLNGSSRIQTVNKSDNELLYELIKEFKLETGVPIICNTSLNDKGEPIVNRISEALNFALRKGIQVAYVNGKRIELMNHSMYKEEKPLSRSLDMSWFSKEELASKLKELNPFNIPDNIIEFYYYNLHLLKGLDLTKKEDARTLLLFHKKYGTN